MPTHKSQKINLQLNVCFQLIAHSRINHKHTNTLSGPLNLSAVGAYSCLSQFNYGTSIPRTLQAPRAHTCCCVLCLCFVSCSTNARNTGYIFAKEIRRVRPGTNRVSALQKKFNLKNTLKPSAHILWENTRRRGAQIARASHTRRTLYTYIYVFYDWSPWATGLMCLH